jgi:DNA invertase Pin-like site-specific DNA recombinase
VHQGVGYRRASTAEQREHGGAGLAAQADAIAAAAARLGLTVRATFDDLGVSGGLPLEQRPALLAALDALGRGDVLLIAKRDRLGRSVLNVAMIERLVERKNARIVSAAGEGSDDDGPTSRLMRSIIDAFSEYERQIIRARTKAALRTKKRRGECVGSVPLGRALAPNGKTLVPFEDEQRVLDLLYELREAGGTLRAVAAELNARAHRTRKGGVWYASYIWLQLRRRGEEITWNRTQKRDSWGQHRQSARPAADWVHVEAPHLRIVTDAAWNAAHTRLSGISARLATARGDRPIVRRDIDSAYLLSGFARCATCGGALSVVSRQHGRQRAFFYGCLAHAKRGREVCPNALVMPVRVVEEAVVRALAGDVLRLAVVMAIIDAVFETLQPTTLKATEDAHRAEIQALDRRIARLTAAVEEGAAVAPLVAQLQARQAERERLLAAIAAAEARRTVALDREALEQKVLAQVATWRGLLTNHVSDGRQLLREVLDGPLRFTAEGRTYRFEGSAAAERLLGQVLPPCVASPARLAPSRSGPFHMAGSVLRAA